MEHYLTPQELEFVEKLGNVVIDTVVDSGHGHEVLSVLSSSLLIGAFASLVESGDYARAKILKERLLSVLDNMQHKPTLN